MEMTKKHIGSIWKIKAWALESDYLGPHPNSTTY